jgi:hypothetical protein
MYFLSGLDRAIRIRPQSHLHGPDGGVVARGFGHWQRFLPPSLCGRLRRQRKPVSGWTIIRLSRHCGHQRDSRSKTGDQSDGSRGDEFGCAPARQFDGRSAIDSKSSAVRVRRSLRATETAPLVGFTMEAGYRHAFETTNESVRIKF